MKKLTISLLAVIFSLGTAFSQPVSDLGIIPVGVTLNSILRLNIVSGGNIEYVVNTISQYTNGIPNIPRYDTRFNVASSVDFDVTLISDAATFIGVDDAANVLPLNNLGYIVDEDVGATGVDATNWDLTSAIQPLTNAQVYVIGGNYAGLGAGDIDQNAFVIHWELGTLAAGMNAATLLAQSITSDRYVVNVILELSQHTVAVVVP